MFGSSDESDEDFDPEDMDEMLMAMMMGGMMPGMDLPGAGTSKGKNKGKGKNNNQMMPSEDELLAMLGGGMGLGGPGKKGGKGGKGSSMFSEEDMLNEMMAAMMMGDSPPGMGKQPKSKTKNKTKS